MAFTARTETYVDLASLTTPFDITVTKPTGTVNGDILFCWIAWYHPSASIDSVPSGWQLLGDYTANLDKYALYYKVASDEGASWDWSFTGTLKVRAVCSCYTGGDFNALDPIDVVSNTAYRTSDTNAIAASMTVAAANSPLIFWAGVSDLSERTFTKPSVPTTDWVEDDDAGSQASDFWTEVCSMIWSGSGATGAMSATLSASDAQKHAFAVALNPAAGGVNVTPSPASAIGSVIAPTVVKGSVSITPVAIQAIASVVAPTVQVSAPFSVQRGLISLEGTTTEVEVSLTTPVPVGKSFVIASCRADNSPVERALAEVRLTTPVSGNYTKIKATKYADYGNCYVEWQVITGDDFTVQEGETSFSDGDATHEETISAVDLSKAFIVLSLRGGSSTCEPYFNFVRGRFTSTTQIELAVQIGSATYYPVVYWYVVEWNGASVQSGLVTVSTDVNTASISQVNLDKAFLLFTYKTLSSTWAVRAFYRGRFSANNTLEFKRGASYPSYPAYVSYFVVEHPSISVQSGLKAIDGTSGTEVLGTAVDLSKAFMPVPIMGNGYCSEGDSIQTLHYGWNTHKLWQDGSDSKLTIQRENDTGILNASWFVMEAYGAVVITPSPAQAVGLVIAPTVIQSSITATPEHIDCIAQVVQPAVIGGNIIYAPTPIDAIAKAVNPSVIYGAIIPSPVSAIGAVVNPIVVLSSISITPTSIEAIGQVVAPIVGVDGTIYITPDAIDAIGGRVNPTVILGAITLTPTALSAIAQVAIGNVRQGNIIFSPAFIKALGKVVAPTVIYGSLTLEPESIEAIARGENPEVILASMTVTPEFVKALAGVIAPTVLQTWIGRKLRLVIITSQYRKVNVVTGQKRKVIPITTQKRKVNVITGE